MQFIKIVDNMFSFFNREQEEEEEQEREQVAQQILNFR